MGSNDRLSKDGLIAPLCTGTDSYSGYGMGVGKVLCQSAKHCPAAGTLVGELRRISAIERFPYLLAYRPVQTLNEAFLQDHNATAWLPGR